MGLHELFGQDTGPCEILILRDQPSHQFAKLLMICLSKDSLVVMDCLQHKKMVVLFYVTIYQIILPDRAHSNYYIWISRERKATWCYSLPGVCAFVINTKYYLSFEHALIYLSLSGDLLYMHYSHLNRWSDNTQVQQNA